MANSDTDVDIEHRWPHVLPEGKGTLFVAQKGRDDWTLAVVSFETGETHLLNESGTYPRYAASGHLVFAREGTLFAAAFDLARLETTSPAVPVLSDVGQGGAGEAYYDIASDGTLIYISGQTKPETGLVWVDRQGETRLLGPRRRASWRTPRWSPDGRFVVAALEPQDGPPDLWLTDIARESLTRFTSDPPNTRPVWSPDSRSVIYLKGQTSVRQPTETTEPPVTLAECGEPQAVSSDGQLLLCDRRGEAEDFDIVLVRLDGSGEAEPLLDSRFDEHDGRLSPDDRWLAYVSDESGRAEVYVQPFPDLGRKIRISVDGGKEPAWSRDGRELFYRHERVLYSVPFSAAGEAGRPTPLFSGDFWTGTNVRGTYYDVSLDGQHFVMIQSEPSEVRPEIHVVLNWFEELKRLVPTR